MTARRRSYVPGFLRSRTGLALVGFLVAAAFFVLTEHTAHLFGALPYLLLACPLLHLFMHGGHGGGHAGHRGGKGADGGER